MKLTGDTEPDTQAARFLTGLYGSLYPVLSSGARLVWVLPVVGFLTLTGSSLRADPSAGKGRLEKAKRIASLRIVLTDPPDVTFVMRDGAEYSPEHIEKGTSFPPPGRYRGSKSEDRAFHIHVGGRANRYWIRGPIPQDEPAPAAFHRDRGTFDVRVLLPGDTGSGPGDANDDANDDDDGDDDDDDGRDDVSTPASGDSAGRHGGKPAGMLRRDADRGRQRRVGSARSDAQNTRVRSGREAQAASVLARVADQAQLAELLSRLPADQRKQIVGKLERSEVLTYREALALLEVFHPAVEREQEGRSALKDWKRWARFLDKHGHLIEGKFERGANRATLRQFQQYLARHKRHVELREPPEVTGQQRKAQVASDPDTIAAWNGLEPWERELWNAYWTRLPNAAQPARGRAPLRLTQSTRFLIALQMSTEYMPEDFRAAARQLFSETSFLTIAATSMTLYVVAMVAPEPLFSKATAATITAVLLTMVGLNAIYDAVYGLYQLRKAAGQARSIGELDAAAQVFGRTIGARGFEVIAALATYFIGARLPAPTVGVQITPGGGAIAAGGAVAASRVAVIDGMKIAWIDGQLVMFPMVAAVAAGGEAGGGDGQPPGSGPRAGGSGTAGTTSKPRRTPKAPSAKGTRVNTDKTGTWIGMRGEGILIPNGTNWRIPFVGGRPVLDGFVKAGHTFNNVKGLRGSYRDTSIMLQAVIRRFGKKHGFKTETGARDWLNRYKTKYGQSLELHHSGSGQFQLVPKRVHDAVQHGGFKGSASRLRKEK